MISHPIFTCFIMPFGAVLAFIKVIAKEIGWTGFLLLWRCDGFLRKPARHSFGIPASPHATALTLCSTPTEFTAIRRCHGRLPEDDTCQNCILSHSCPALCPLSSLDRH